MTPAAIFAKYKTLPEDKQRDIRVMVDMIANWEEVKDINYSDTYLSKLKSKIEEAIIRIDLIYQQI